MTSGRPARSARRYRIRRIRLAGLVCVITVLAALSYEWPASSSSADSSSVPVLRRERPRPHGETRGVAADGALGQAGGAVPDGTTVFDDEVPGVARLDPDLLGALRRAATDAAADGVRFDVVSGWRSAAYQEQLLHEAIAQYGSEAAAMRWVATPQTSAHVQGDAVDIGPSAAAAWLSAHGAASGLCQIYGNEPWHYELRPEAIDHGCPPRYADPTHDPRMQP